MRAVLGEVPVGVLEISHYDGHQIRNDLNKNLQLFTARSQPGWLEQSVIRHLINIFIEIWSAMTVDGGG